MNRREFLALAAASTFTTSHAWSEPVLDQTQVTARHLPRWRGFNITDKCVADYAKPFRETDLEWMAEWGFDFARVPMDYRCWSETSDPLSFREEGLKEIDQVVEFGRKHKIHINLNHHRAFGYCVNPPKEPLDLWTDDKAQDIASAHWGMFARRYKGIPNTRLSFDLFNEPAIIPEASYVKVVKRMVEAIRAEDPDRLIIADGLKWGREPVHGLAGLGIAQSTRGYDPMQISHYKASWVGKNDQWPLPTWPMQIKEGDRWDKERLREEKIEPWKSLERHGVGVHVGEWGAFSYTPHEVALAWMKDCLDLWREAGWGWAMWNFRGSFGILDSNRADVQYEDFHWHKLDRKMLELLRKA
jgi:endoglucanase